MLGKVRDVAGQAGINNAQDAKQVVDKITTALKWCFRIMYCCLCMAGFAGLVFGIAVGLFFLASYPDDGGSIICAIGCAFGVVIFVYCGYQAYTLRSIWNTTELALTFVSEASCTKEQLIAKIKDKLSAKVSDKIGTMGAGFLGDMILDELKNQLRQVLFGPPALAVLMGISLTGGSGQVDHDTGKVLALAVGILLIVGGVFGLCIALPVYCLAVREVESAVDKIKDTIAERIKANVEDAVDKGVNKAVDAVVATG